jgi:hypothetical protein
MDDVHIIDLETNFINVVNPTEDTLHTNLFWNINTYNLY